MSLVKEEVGNFVIARDEQHLERCLSDMPPWARLAFMAGCCQRMIPDYARFSDASGWGDVGVLHQAVSAVWACVEGNGSPDRIGELISACEGQLPDTEDFDSPDALAALGAAVAVIATLEGALEGAPVARALLVAELARDSVHFAKGIDPESELHAQWAQLEVLSQARGKQDILRDLRRILEQVDN